MAFNIGDVATCVKAFFAGDEFTDVPNVVPGVDYHVLDYKYCEGCGFQSIHIGQYTKMLDVTQPLMDGCPCCRKWYYSHDTILWAAHTHFRKKESIFDTKVETNELVEAQ